MYNRSFKLVMFRYTIALQEFGMVQGQGAKKGPRSELELVGAAVLGTAMAMVHPKRKTHCGRQNTVCSPFFALFTGSVLKGATM